MIMAIDVVITAFIVPVVNVVSILVAPVAVFLNGVVARVSTLDAEGRQRSLAKVAEYACSIISSRGTIQLSTPHTFSSIVTFIALFLAVHRLHQWLMMIQL
jgi:hypothetical protein